MPRRPIITQAAIARAVKGFQTGGLKVGRVEIDGGKISVYSTEDVRQEPASEFDGWKAKRHAR